MNARAGVWRRFVAVTAFVAAAGAPAPSAAQPAASASPAMAPVSPARTAGAEPRCLHRVYLRAQLLPPHPADSRISKAVDTIPAASLIETDRYAVYKSDPAIRGAFSLYAAYDPAAKVLLVQQRAAMWTYSTLYALPSLPCAIPAASLGGMRTKAGLHLGSSEHDVIAALGPGNATRGAGVTGRYYEDQCSGIMFTFRAGRVIAIDADPGAAC